MAISSKLKSLPTRVLSELRLYLFSKEFDAMSEEYSLSDLLERLYQNQLALEAALMELTLHAEQQGSTGAGDNIRGALWTIG